MFLQTFGLRRRYLVATWNRDGIGCDDGSKSGNTQGEKRSAVLVDAAAIVTRRKCGYRDAQIALNRARALWGMCENGTKTIRHPWEKGKKRKKLDIFLLIFCPYILTLIFESTFLRCIKVDKPRKRCERMYFGGN